MTKVREIITINGWTDGSGWNYNQCYSDAIIDVDPGSLTHDADMDWSWWECNDPRDGEDVEITVSYYNLDADPTDDDPIAEWSTWESEIRN